MTQIVCASCPICKRNFVPAPFHYYKVKEKRFVLGLVCWRAREDWKAKGLTRKTKSVIIKRAFIIAL